MGLARAGTTLRAIARLRALTLEVFLEAIKSGRANPHAAEVCGASATPPDDMRHLNGF
jgi:hypothetical protein